jgi:8-oxo-dGTP pyrophosphatase MutT (NUDIX family)
VTFQGYQNIPRAVCIVIQSEDLYVAVTRPIAIGKPRYWALPGGKVDPGETCLEAIVREVREEIGLTIDPNHVVSIYEAPVPGEQPYIVTAYVYTGFTPSLDDLTAEAGLVIGLVGASVLMNPDYSKFTDYNSRVLCLINEYQEENREEWKA